MRLNAVKMLGISITTTSKKEILEETRKYLETAGNKSIKPLVIVTPNPEQIVFAQKNAYFADILNRADVAIPDGIGLVLASKITGSKAIKERIAGIDLMEDLAAVASKRAYPIALIGGRGELAVQAFDCLQKTYPQLRGWGEDGPEINADKIEKSSVNALVEKIQKSKTRIVFVGLGAPKQEFFIEELAKNLHGIVFMSVGGSFDIIAGRIPRAPVAFRFFGLEWFWRLVFEPWRIKRQLALLTFAWLVLKERK